GNPLSNSVGSLDGGMIITQREQGDDPSLIFMPNNFTETGNIGYLGYSSNEHLLQINSPLSGNIKFAVLGGPAESSFTSFIVDTSTNRVGIGTSTPLATLHVDGTVAFQGTNFATTTIGSFDNYITIGEYSIFSGAARFPLISSLS